MVDGFLGSFAFALFDEQWKHERDGGENDKNIETLRKYLPPA